MVVFILGMSIAINCVFIALWIYGIQMDKRIKREAQDLINNTQVMSFNMDKNWMYE
tara:strand:- start:204 stop:371 length:168 start_codon:yes stop_codon:yes gene_type:complete